MDHVFQDISFHLGLNTWPLREAFIRRLTPLIHPLLTALITNVRGKKLDRSQGYIESFSLRALVFAERTG